MKTAKIVKTGLFLGMAALTQHAQALSISAVPSSASVLSGSSFNVDLVVSGLHDLGIYPNNEIISAFDLGLGFDSSVIQATSITVGGLTTIYGDSGLGDGIFDSFRDSDLNFDFAAAKAGETYTGPTYAHAVRLSEFSFLDSNDLQIVQPDSFILGSIAFTAIGIGNSGIDFIHDGWYTGTSALLDVKGVDGVTPLNPAFINGHIVVTTIPEPSTLWLMAISMIGLAGFSKRTQKYS